MIQPLTTDLAQDFQELILLCNKAEILIQKIRGTVRTQAGGGILIKGFTDIEIYAQVCESMGMKPDEVRRACRTKGAVRDRGAVIEKLHEFGWGPSRIGRVVAKGHDTVIHSLRKPKSATP